MLRRNSHKMTKDMRTRFIKIGLNISYYRKLKGISQERLAEGIGRSRNFISRLEAPNMYERPSVMTLLQIADFLEIPAIRLLDFKEDI